MRDVGFKTKLVSKESKNREGQEEEEEEEEEEKEEEGGAKKGMETNLGYGNHEN